MVYTKFLFHESPPRAFDRLSLARVFLFSQKGLIPLEVVMAFRENLLKKIDIETMTETVKNSLGTYDNPAKLDRQTLKKLLEKTSFKPLELRNLEMFVDKTPDGKDEILVLDNDLPIYHTTPEDVVLRKSPTIKEMVNIRNAMKILNDKDVLVSKKEVSLARIQRECLGALDLSFTRKDIEDIERQGIDSLERDDPEGLREALVLYAEILGLKPVPAKFRMNHHELWARTETLADGQVSMEPVVMVNLMTNTLKIQDVRIKGSQRETMEALKALSSGNQQASGQGKQVFEQLTRKVADQFGDSGKLPVD
jgi:hypothetical protein